MRRARGQHAVRDGLMVGAALTLSSVAGALIGLVAIGASGQAATISRAETVTGTPRPWLSYAPTRPVPTASATAAATPSAAECTPAAGESPATNEGDE